MTTRDNGDNRPSIILHSVNPENDKKKIILALVASFRWYSAYLFSGHNNISDKENLLNIAMLLEYVCNTVITSNCKQKKLLIIYLGDNIEEEYKERLMSGLIGATRWYANSADDDKYNTNETDAKNLSMLTKLHQGLLKYFNTEIQNHA